MTVKETINVTEIEPRLKHPTIFEKFDGLGGNEAIVIHNDHDPKPLYYQLLGERGEIFEWEYLVNGPEQWEVRITRLNDGEKPETIGELVASDYRKAEVFKKFGLDFCCGGKKSVEEACEKKGIDVTKVKEALRGVDEVKESIPSEDFNKWSLDFLSDYIMNTHHNYVKEAIPVLHQYLNKVSKVHGGRHPELVQIYDLYIDLANELEMHMRKEEMILFPYIKELVHNKQKGNEHTPPEFESIRNPINMMEAEHDTAGDNLSRMKELSNGFQPPEDACTTYRVSFQKLQEFEDDLHRHIHLENNILFPKAIKLEEELLSR